MELRRQPRGRGALWRGLDVGGGRWRWRWGRGWVAVGGRHCSDAAPDCRAVFLRVGTQHACRGGCNKSREAPGTQVSRVVPRALARGDVTRAPERDTPIHTGRVRGGGGGWHEVPGRVRRNHAVKGGVWRALRASMPRKPHQAPVASAVRALTPPLRTLTDGLTGAVLRADLVLGGTLEFTHVARGSHVPRRARLARKCGLLHEGQVVRATCAVQQGAGGQVRACLGAEQELGGG